MKLSNRNKDYKNDNSVLDSTEREISGQYRGHCCKYKLPNHILQNRPKINLQYRSIPYSIFPQEKIITEYITPFQFTQKSGQVTRHHNTEKIHLENLRLNLMRRLDLAKVKGNVNLIEMLEKEFQQLQIK